MSVDGSGPTVGSTTDTQGADEGQMSRGSLAMAWYGTVSAMFFLYIGAALAVGYGTRDALIGLALTIAVYGVINCLIARRALEDRVSVAQFSRSILGRSGSILATVIFAATAIYYAVFEGAIVAFALQTEFGGPTWLWSTVVVLTSTPLVLGGARRFLDKFNGYLLPIYWGGLVLAVVWASVRYGADSTWLTQAPAMSLPLSSGGPGWLATFAAYMGVWIFMMYTMDFASLGRRSDAGFHGRVTFGWVFYTLAFGLNALIGIFLSFVIPGTQASETGIAGSLVTMMGPLGLLLIVVSQSRINTANYLMGIENLRAAGQRLFRITLPFAFWVALGGFVIFLLMLLPVTQYLLVALAWQGVLVTGWVGIAVAHILVSRRSEEGRIPDHAYRAYNKAGLIAWSVATAIGLYFINAGLTWGPTWGPIVTAVLSAALYLIVRSLTKEESALDTNQTPLSATQT